MTDSTRLREIRQEPEGVQGKTVRTTLALAIVIMVLAVLASSLLMSRWFGEVKEPAAPPRYPAAETVGEIYQVLLEDRPRGLAKKAEAERALGQFRRIGSVAQIPIDRAMDWLADDAKRGALSFPDPGTVSDAGAAEQGRTR